MAPSAPLSSSRVLSALARRLALATLVITPLIGIAAPAHAAQWVDVATISSTLGNTPGRLCVGAGKTDIACPANTPLLDSASGLLTVPTDLRVTGNLYVSGSQQFDGVTFSNGGVSATGAVTATVFMGSGAGITDIPLSSLPIGDRIVSTTSNIVVGADGIIRFSTGGVSNTAYLDTTGRYIGPGVSTTGAINTPLLNAGEARVRTDLYIGGNLYVSGSQSIDGVSFANGGVSATGAITATTFYGDGSGLTNVPATSLVAAGNVGSIQYKGAANEISGSGLFTYDATNNRLNIGGTGGTAPFNLRGSTGGAMMELRNANANGYSGTELQRADGTWGAFFGYNEAADHMRFNVNTGSHRFFTNSIERIRVTNAGLTGFATTDPKTLLDISGTLRISNGAETCDTDRLGAIRYTNNQFQVCRNTANGWETMLAAVGGSGTADADRITSGTTQVIATNNTSISLVTAGLERVVVGTNGNVGIGQQPTAGLALAVSGSSAVNGNMAVMGNLGLGTSAPALVAGSSSRLLAIEGPANPGIAFRQGTGNQYFMYARGNQFSMFDASAGADRWILDSNGYMGFYGVLSPKTPLEVQGEFRLGNTNLTCDADRLGAIKYQSGSFWVCQSTSNGWEAMATTGENSLADRITSGTTQVIVKQNTSVTIATAGVERMVVGTNGNVGIGQQPTAGLALAVSGSSSINGNLTATGLATAQNIYATDTLTIGNPVIGNIFPSANLKFGVENTAAGVDLAFTGNGYARQFFADRSQGTDLKNYELLNYLGNFYISRLNDGNTTRTYRFTIDKSGNIGLGKDNPLTAADISGTLKIANGGEACDTSRLGAIRYTNNQFQVCRNTTNGWETMLAAIGGSGTADADRITSGTLAVSANGSNNTLTLATGGTTWGYLGSAASYLPQLNAVGISATSVTATTIAVPSQSGLIKVGTYGTMGETSGGLAYIIGNAVRPSLASNNMVEKTHADAGQYIRMRYDTGISFHTNITGAAGTQSADTAQTRMLINLAGNVGIGTTNPSTLLDISGTLKIADTGELCDIARLGAIKYQFNQFYVCRNVGNGWETLLAAIGGTGTAQADRLISGTLAMIANSNTSIISLTTVSTTWGYIGLNSFLPALSFNSISGSTISASVAIQSPLLQLTPVTGGAGVSLTIQGADNLGNHSATMGLTMNGFDITGAGTISATTAVQTPVLQLTPTPGAAGVSLTIQGADNLGNHVATMGLTMSGYNIVGAGNISATGAIEASVLQLTGVTGSAGVSLTIQGADNLGNHVATMGLTMSGYNIVGAGNISATGAIEASVLQLTGVTGSAGVSLTIQGADNLGNHVATMGLTMSGYNIVGAGTVSATSVETQLLQLASVNGSAGVSLTIQGADNLGNHVATMGLTMSGYNIVGAGTVSATSVETQLLQLASVNGSAGVSLTIQGADNLGNHTATTNLNMAGFNITNAGGISATGLTINGIAVVPGASGDRITSSTLTMVANPTGFVSLTTSGSTWGYLGATGSYLPTLSANLVSSTNVSATVMTLTPIAGSSGLNISLTTALSALTDVTLGTPVSGSVLTYNAATSKWVAGSAASADRLVSGTFTLLANSTGYVSLTTGGSTWGYLGAGTSFLPTISSNFVSSTNVSASVLMLTPVAGGTGLNTSLTTALSALTDVTLGTPVSGSVLTYNAATGKWTSGAAASTDRIVSGTTQFVAYSNTSASIVTNGIERMVVGTNGNVGIGVQPSTNAVEISGTTRVSGTLQLTGASPCSGTTDTGKITFDAARGKLQICISR